MNIDLYLEAQFSGSILNAKVYIEGYEITIWFPHPTKPNTKFRKLPNYPIDNDIDIILRTWGKAGSHIDLVVKVNANTVGTIRCVNNPGHGIQQVSIPAQQLLA